MATKTKKYFSDTSKTKVKKTMTISAALSAELDRVKSEAIAAGLGRLNLSEWFGDKVQEFIPEVEAIIAAKKQDSAETSGLTNTQDTAGS